MQYKLPQAIGIALLWMVFLISGIHPLGIAPIIVGVFLPDIDAFKEKYHRSWLAHTYLAPALMFILVNQINITNISSIIINIINLLSVGITIHFFCDYIYPKSQTHTGSEWPVRPSIGSTPWGLIWLGISWSIQWFGYLSIEFIPWLITSLT